MLFWKTSLLVPMFLFACGQEVASPSPAEPAELEDASLCYAYVFDQFNLVGPLPGSPIIAAMGTCVNVPAGADNRISSFRMTCHARFYDGAGCTGPAYAPPQTYGNMPLLFNNRASSIRF